MRLPLLGLLLTLTVPAFAALPRCDDVAATLATSQKLDRSELATALDTLARNGRLPERYVTKRDAQTAGWQPGRDLWQVLPGHSIGGDRFGNREQRLPQGQYREADLDYRGGKRGAKRLVFEPRGRRFVTVDHYRTFTELPACQP
ncbi:ribonuclease domain-containing protein [Jeongeupia naejangsanensis]|uniref:Ribonuclease n=1 Tax=Jeongeupia naejangsanensis TaxID=613195 RepID=A0ABS2BJ02_9NEIS|nr:ribonuclease domain-containing protein [Jeongeupia naejangsanensis]MBM3115587.1 ribonuclease [Jeongeupia naejangsanensis]